MQKMCTLQVRGTAVDWEERTTTGGMRFEAVCPEHGPPGLADDVLRAGRQWCEGVVSAYPNVTARAWREEASTVVIEAIGETEIIRHFVGSLEESIRSAGAPLSVGAAARGPLVAA